MNNKKTFWALAGILALSAPLSAQVSNYTFSQQNGVYTPLASPTIVTTVTASNNDLDRYFSTQDLPFTFNFNGTNYNKVNIYSDGYVTFGDYTNILAHYKPISSSTDEHEGVIAAMSDDLVGLDPNDVPGKEGEISYEIVGTAPNREFVIQWKNFTRYNWRTNYDTDRYEMNFQIRLQENGTIKSVYDVGVVGDPGDRFFTSGLRGADTSDFAVRYNHSNTGGVPNADNWTTTQAGTQPAHDIWTSPQALPPSGLTFVWTPQVQTSNTCAAVSNFNFTFEGMDAAQLFSTHCWNGSFTTYPTVSVTNAVGSGGNIQLPDNVIQIYNGMASGADIILVTPQVSTTSGTHRLAFDIEVALSGTPSAITGTENIEIGTLANPTDFSSFATTGVTFPVSATGTFNTPAITFPTGHKYVALKFNLGAPHKALVIDNVKWEENTLATSEVSKESKDVIVSPNPTADFVTIQTKDKVKAVSIFNTAGNVVLQATSEKLDVSHLPKGLYIIKVTLQNGKEVSKKLIKK